MKLLKKMAFALLCLITLSAMLAFFYFDRKFSPEENCLHIKNESGKVQIKWGDEKKSMLLPIHFESDTTTYYFQFDTGSPSTLLYKNAITEIKSIAINDKTAQANFKIGKSVVKSEKWKVIDFGSKPQDGNLKIIGTIGTDILENRKTILNFKDNYVVFNCAEEPKKLQNKSFDFIFKKRKIIIPATLQGNKEKFLYDSGTSGYELLTNKEIWDKLKIKNSKILSENGRSWNNILTTYTAETNETINFTHTQIPLHHITYVEGFSKTQYYMMKFSGMSGMLGNKMFLQKQMYIDAKNMKMAIE